MQAVTHLFQIHNRSTASSNAWTETEFPLPSREAMLRFRQVEGLTTPIFTYAALQEDNIVRIITIKPLNAEIKNLYCVFLDFKSGPIPRFAVNASVKNIPEDHNSTFTAAYISCQINTTESNPDYVGLVPEKNQAQWPSHMTSIEGGGDSQKVSEEVSSARRPWEEREVEFSVCTPPMFFKFDNAAQLVEMLEMSRLLGAGRVVFYNNSIAPNVDAVLSLYIRQYQLGMDSLEVKVHSWQLPTFVENGVNKTIEKQEDIHYYGQMAAVDHCLHRYRKVSRYIVFSDLDEVVIPVRHATWSELIAERQGETNTGT
ncbi:beta-1,4-galactosyltransferase galt-1 [Elysia marginata]|uniref:Glycosyltransferase family 92 protein n=1 Tax=Elysia marginata TaxID=1093978 RepID=A0AAV4HHF7_9GAST|nr:beta-1,4-galactosyltransferase galt-1 [Elysia marginata]